MLKGKEGMMNHLLRCTRQFANASLNILLPCNPSSGNWLRNISRKDKSIQWSWGIYILYEYIFLQESLLPTKVKMGTHVTEMRYAEISTIKVVVVCYEPHFIDFLPSHHHGYHLPVQQRCWDLHLLQQLTKRGNSGCPLTTWHECMTENDTVYCARAT